MQLHRADSDEQVKLDSTKLLASCKVSCKEMVVDLLQSADIYIILELCACPPDTSSVFDTLPAAPGRIVSVNPSNKS